MLLFKLCRKCKGIVITRNDGTTKDKLLYKEYEKKDCFCKCD